MAIAAAVAASNCTSGARTVAITAILTCVDELMKSKMNCLKYNQNSKLNIVAFFHSNTMNNAKSINCVAHNYGTYLRDRSATIASTAASVSRDSKKPNTARLLERLSDCGRVIQPIREDGMGMNIILNIIECVAIA
jgi:hypothetical protein